MKALRILGLSNEEVLHVGDSYPNDVLGAKAAAIPVLWINRKHRRLNPTDIAPESVAHDLSGVLEYIE